MRLGDYELIDEIARGGMGVVYRARQLSLNRIVALKVVLHGPFSSRDFVRRFCHEAQVVAALRHPNIVAIYEVGESNGTHFLSLEFVQGRNFAAIARERLLPAQRVAGYLKVIAEAVEHAHRRGVLHRDLKPSNILLDELDQPRVTDFGLAKLVNQDTELTVTGQILGSPNYMAPEQAAGKSSASTPQSDIYSLGAILYELLSGRPAFQGETLQSILNQAQQADPLPPRRLNPSTPEDLQSICMKCLQKEPERRYASAQEFADDLGRFLESKPVLARPVSRLERTWLWCRRRPLLAAMSTGLFLAVLLGVTGILWQWRAAEFHAQGELEQRLIAQAEEEATRLNLYAADIAVASEMIRDGNYGLARRTLERLRPQPDEADLRGFEWRYLWNLCRGNQLATLAGHTATVTCAAFSPDGKFLATGSQDGTVKIWSAPKRRLIKTFHVTSKSVWSVGFTPDGEDIFTGYDCGVELWDLDSDRVEKTFPGELAVLSRTGALLATADSSPFFWEPAGDVKIWNLHSGLLLRTFDQPGRALALSPDGGLLAMAGQNTGITVWNTSDGKLLRTWSTANPIWSLNFSPDSRELVSAGWSSDVQVWQLDGFSPPQTFSNGELHVWSAVFSVDGTTIATTSSDQTVRLWDSSTLQLKTTLHGHGGEVWCAAFSPDGELLATGGKDQNVLLWPTAPSSSQNELPHDEDFRPLFSPDGKWLVTVNPNNDRPMLWKTENSTLAATNLAEGGQIVGFSRDGKSVATFDSYNLKLEYWLPDGSTPQRESTLQKCININTPFAFAGMSPEQEYFFAIDAEGLICIWNTDTGDLLCTLRGPVPGIRNAVLSPHGKQIAVSVDRENITHLFDCTTGIERHLDGHRDFVSGLDFSPDGATLVTGSMDGTIKLWNTTNGLTIATLPGHMQETSGVVFSPDGRTLASLGRDESLKIWNVSTRREVISEAEPKAGTKLVFSPDGKMLAVETDKDKLRILEAPPE